MPLTNSSDGQWTTGSEEATIEVGRRIGRQLDAPAVLLLEGPLGAGKTVLARGLAAGLGVADVDEVHSPTFTLVNQYQGRHRIYHLDLYRLEHSRDFQSIGIDEILGASAVVLIEWGDKLQPVPAGALQVRIEDLGGDGRRITLSRQSPVASRE